MASGSSRESGCLWAVAQSPYANGLNLGLRGYGLGFGGRLGCRACIFRARKIHAWVWGWIYTRFENH